MRDVWRWSKPSGRLIAVPGAAAVWPRPTSHYDRLYGCGTHLEGWWIDLAGDLVTLPARGEIPSMRNWAAILAGPWTGGFRRTGAAGAGVVG